MNTGMEQSKGTAEVVDLEADFLSQLILGETVLAASCSVVVHSGEDPNPSAMLSGVPSIAGSIVTQKIQGGVAGVIYTVSFAIRTSLVNVYVQDFKLAVLTSTVVPPSP